MDAQFAKLSSLPGQYMEAMEDAPGYDELKEKCGQILDSPDPQGPRGGRIIGSRAVF